MMPFRFTTVKYSGVMNSFSYEYFIFFYIFFPDAFQ